MYVSCGQGQLHDKVLLSQCTKQPTIDMHVYCWVKFTWSGHSIITVNYELILFGWEIRTTMYTTETLETL